MAVTLRRYADADLALTLRLETDPVAMAELGGPRAETALLRAHAVRLGEPYALVIEQDGVAVGSIGCWRSEHEADPIHEVGWLVLPEYHGHGLATAGLRSLLVLLAGDPAVTALHAFPGATNVASNRLCDRFGFADLGALDVEFGDTVLHTRHRLLALARAPDRAGARGGDPTA